MAFLFRKRKKRETTVTDENRDRILRQMVNACLRMQTGWAQWMGRRTQHLSRRTLLLLLLPFIAIAGGYNIYLIRQGFSGNQVNAFSVTAIKKPGLVTKTGDAKLQKEKIISKTDYQRIIRFRGYLDSLARSFAGKAVHDSILLSRPGLQDSIRYIEEIYQTQTKK